MSSGKPLRGVAVYDIELEGGVGVAAAFEEILQEYTHEFNKYLKGRNSRLASLVTITQAKAAVPLQERRGATGDLDQIVFRGTRGGYASAPTTELVIVDILKDKGVLICRIANKKNDGKSMFEYPLSKLPTRSREGILAAWVLGDGTEGDLMVPIKTETFERFAKPI
jgi:hypothetical protein